jgi:hypothetical protein
LWQQQYHQHHLLLECPSQYNWNWDLNPHGVVAVIVDVDVDVDVVCYNLKYIANCNNIVVV